MSSAPALKPRQVLDQAGVLTDGHEVSTDALVRTHRDLVRARALDERAIALQRKGWLRSYYQSSGQEAVLGAVYALREQDWIFTAYREPHVWLARGVSPFVILSQWKGLVDDGWDPRELRITRLNATIGTHLPHATGFAYGRRLLDEDTVSLAIFGDGGTSTADFHAGLNFAGVWRTPTVFLCQNNQYAEATPVRLQTASDTLARKAAAYGMPGVLVDGMDPLAVEEATRDAVERAVAGGGPTLIECLTYRFAPHSSYDGRPVYRTADEEDEWRDRDPILRVAAQLAHRGVDVAALHEETVTALGAEVDEAVAEINRRLGDRPSRASMSRHLVADLPARLVRQLEDEAAAEGEPELGLPVPDRPAEPRPDGPTSTRTQVEVIRATLEHELSTRPDLVILGEDVAIEGGVFRATKDLHLKFGLERVIDTPLSENGIVGAAVGMAMAGLRPVVEIMFAGFSYIGIDQVIGHVGRMRWRTRGQVSLPLVIRMPAGGGFASPVEFHSDSPEAMFVHNPGLTVVYPSTAYDAKGLLASAIASDDPVIVFEPILRNHLPEDGVPDEHYTVPIGVAAVRRPGRDLTVVTYGNGVAASLDAADLLADEGIELEVIDLRTLYPFDEDSVLASVRRTGRLLTVHEAALTAGLGAEIAATVAEQALEYLDAPVARVGHADTFWHPGAELESFSMVTPSRIAAAARRIVRGG